MATAPSPLESESLRADGGGTYVGAPEREGPMRVNPSSALLGEPTVHFPVREVEAVPSASGALDVEGGGIEVGAQEQEGRVRVKPSSSLPGEPAIKLPRGESGAVPPAGMWLLLSCVWLCEDVSLIGSEVLGVVEGGNEVGAQEPDGRVRTGCRRASRRNASAMATAPSSPTLLCERSHSVNKWGKGVSRCKVSGKYI